MNLTSARARTDPDSRRRAREGFALTLAAFLLWGFNPFYFKAVADVPPLEILAHRVVWSVALLVPFYLALRRPWPFRVLRRDPRLLRMLLASTTIIAGNWLIYIYAIASDQVLQASLGYYITPLVNVAMGILLLRERLTAVQALAVALAATGVVLQAIGVGALPWIGLGIAISFGTYGLLRKQMGIGAIDGMFVEVVLMLPIAFGFLVWWEVAGTAAFSHRGLATDLLLIAAGPVTAIPLGLFAAGARRITMVALGFCQYLAPSIYFLLGLFWYGEPFGAWSLASFVAIWLAIAVFTADGLRTLGRRAAN
jgi:chloramphenicol-sensitive protein RarD